MGVKHPLLSDLIDFGKKWFNKPCSQQYMSEVQTIFGEIRRLMQDNQ